MESERSAKPGGAFRSDCLARGRSPRGRWAPACERLRAGVDPGKPLGGPKIGDLQDTTVRIYEHVITLQEGRRKKAKCLVPFLQDEQGGTRQRGQRTCAGLLPSSNRH